MRTHDNNSNTADSNTADSNTADSNTADSNTADSNTADSNTDDSNTADSICLTRVARETHRAAGIRRRLRRRSPARKRWSTAGCPPCWWAAPGAGCAASHLGCSQGSLPTRPATRYSTTSLSPW